MPKDDPDDRRDLAKRTESEALDHQDEPPIVARMVIEIRSDGTRTIARGAAEDATLGTKVAIEVKGTTPLSLAFSLMKSLGQLPSLAKTFKEAMLPAKKK